MNEGRTIYENGGGLKDRLIAKSIQKIFEQLIYEEGKLDSRTKSGIFPFIYRLVNSGRALGVKSDG
jgi:hypothetical protein